MRQLLDTARTALEREQPQVARILLEHAVRSEPKNGEAWYLLGQAVDDPQQRLDCTARANAAGFTPAVEVPKKRAWSDVFFWLIIFLCLVMALLIIGLTIIDPAIRARTSLWTQSTIWLTASGAVMLVCLALFSVGRIGAALTTIPARARQFSRLALRLIGLGIISGFVLVVVGSMTLYQQYVSFGTVNQNQVVNLAWVGGLTLILSLLLGPQLIVSSLPRAANSPTLRRIFDTGVALLGLILAVLVRFSVNILPAWLLVLIGAAALIILIIAVVGIWRGDSFFQASLDFLDPVPVLRRPTSQAWIAWVDKYLPDPEDQQTLKRVLQEMNPPSHIRALMNFIFVGLGLWLLQQVAGAIIEMYVQDRLRNLFP